MAEILGSSWTGQRFISEIPVVLECEQPDIKKKHIFTFKPSLLMNLLGQVGKQAHTFIYEPQYLLPGRHKLSNKAAMFAISSFASKKDQCQVELTVH